MAKKKKGRPKRKRSGRRVSARGEHSKKKLRDSYTSKRRTRIPQRNFRPTVLTPRQVAVRAQETAFQLLVAMDRGGIVDRFLRRYATEQKRPGRISNAGRFHELAATIRREAFLVFALQVEVEAPQRLGARPAEKMSSAQSGLASLFHEEFRVALRRSLDFDDEEFNDFCRDLELYRRLLGHSAAMQSRANRLVVPAGPFVDRCGFLLDSPMLDQGRRAAAKFESELRATASLVLRKVFSRRSY